MKPAARARAPPPVLKVLHEEDRDSPLGDWQTEGKGMVRIAECGRALCGYAIKEGESEKGEAILINMKPKSVGAVERQRLQQGLRRHLLRHHAPEGTEHAAGRGLRVRPLLLQRQQLDAITTKSDRVHLARQLRLPPRTEWTAGP